MIRIVLTVVLTVISASIAQAQRPPTGVVVAQAIQKEVASGQSFVGTVVPLKIATIGSAVDGRVVEFPLNEGDRVEEGQKLAQLLTETIKLELAAAEGELELRRQQLAELENGTRAEEIEQARAQLAVNEARKEFLAARRKRLQQAFSSSRAITEDELDEAVSAAIGAHQLQMEAKAAYDLALAGPRKEQIAQARAQVAVQEANVERLTDQIGKHTMISRFAGYIVAEHTEIGQWVMRGDPVAEVAMLDEVEVAAQVSEQYVPYVHVGEEVRVEIPALPDRVFEGVVSRVVPQADIRARTFPVKVRIVNEITEQGPLIKAGMYARIMLPTGRRVDATLVPKDALVLGGQRPVVYVIQGPAQPGKQAKAIATPVEMGVAAGRWIQVTGGVNQGDFVVVQGNERIYPPGDVVVQRVTEPEAPAPSTPQTSTSQL